METNTFVFCDWTMLDMIGRFCIFSIWGYYMGKSITTSPRSSMILIVIGVVFCVLYHMWMNFSNIIIESGYVNYKEAMQYENFKFEVEGDGLTGYGLKILLFYLTAGIVGFNMGRKKAQKRIEELDRMYVWLKKMEAEGCLGKDEYDASGKPVDPRRIRKQKAGRRTIVKYPLKSNFLIKAKKLFYKAEEWIKHNFTGGEK